MLTETEAIEGVERLSAKPLELRYEDLTQGWSAHFGVADDELFRLDVPRRGHVLTTVAETYGEPIRKAVGLLTGSLERKQCGDLSESLLGTTRSHPTSDMVRSEAELTAWAIVSMWVIGIAISAIPKTARLADAEKWFFGVDVSERLTDLISARTIIQAEITLQTYAEASAYYDLLPYILDPHGPGSRLSVMRNPATSAARMRKRAEGVFYTPGDVAEYMVSGCLSSIDNKDAPTVFDPACGTGVFLRAALKKLRKSHPHESAFSLASECLFGTDIDQWPLDASAFVLLADIWEDETEYRKSPADIWRCLRSNFACLDTLRIDSSSKNPEPVTGTSKRIPISKLFPKLREEPTIIIGNPPYARLGKRTDLGELGQLFKTLAVKPHANAEIYVAFIEQMTRLANGNACAGSLVLPLSIACNIGHQFIAARKLIQETAGHWQFAFFDREPHALFGEDVKTRNAIIFWSRNESDKKAVLASGPLRKWRGDSRAAMFNSIRFTEFDGDIRAGIPKVGGASQAAALNTLSSQWGHLEQAVQGIERLNLAAAPHAGNRVVFVGPTAYNFLNVFLRPPSVIFEEGTTLSEHPLHAIRCTSPEDALIVFSILSSHLAYWWWHSHGDGFHVSRRFISGFPFGLDAMSGEAGSKLRESGESLWSAIKEQPIISINRGRTSLAYSPNGHDDMRRRTDEVLADIAGLPHILVDELQQFTAHTIAAKHRD